MKIKTALQVIQQAVSVLAKWADVPLPSDCQPPKEEELDPAVKQAKKLFSWTEQSPSYLRSLFDSVRLPDGKGQSEVHYWKAEAIAHDNPTIPYPQSEPPTDAELKCLKLQIQDEINQLNQGDWENLSFLTLILEKFGSYLSFVESDIALVDIAKSTAAVASAIAHNPDATHLNLVAGDLSGIQKFIYTISSDGALKSLRARSFYLELVTEEVVQQLLTALDLPRTNVIYTGGGKLYILADGTAETKNTVKQVRKQFNKWLFDEFQGKVFLALDSLTFPIEDIATAEFAEHWTEATKQLAEQKSRKFVEQITDVIQLRDSYTPCKVCHRDDIKEEELRPLHKENPILVCEVCHNMFDLGGRLFGVKSIVRSHSEVLTNDIPTLSFKLPATEQLPTIQVYYYLFNTWKPIFQNTETVFLVNDWTIEHYRLRHFCNPIPLLLGNYGKKSKVEPGFMRAGEMAEKAKGIKRVGYLRMDVDNLGQIFAKGLREQQTLLLPRLAGLSRQMSYFFKVYLNSLAEFRKRDFLELRKTVKVLENVGSLSECDRQNLLFIYAGGDDLFISGAWNEIVEFAFDIYQCFRAYTGWNPDITLSGGISIDDIKFPLYLAADESGEAEEAAKGNGKDSLGLFGEKFKWDEWLGIDDVSRIDPKIIDYLKPDSKPNLLGVLPFVERLTKQKIEVNYSRNFVRNLLITAQLQEQALKKYEDSNSDDAMGTRYYLHLPKIAYTLARLPKDVLKDEKFRTSLKSPYNAPYFRAIATWIEFLTRQS